MPEPQPTAADKALAEELLSLVPWGKSFAELCEWKESEQKDWAAIIARHVAEQTAELRAERDELVKAITDWKEAGRYAVASGGKNSAIGELQQAAKRILSLAAIASAEKGTR